jgi:hypothetical protein
MATYEDHHEWWMGKDCEGTDRGLYISTMELLLLQLEYN